MRKLVGVAVVAVAFAVATASYGLHDLWSDAAAAERHAPGPPPGIPVTAGKVVAADEPDFLTGIGSVQAYNTVTIKSRVDGQIVAVNFKEGQEIKAGDALFQIDPRPYQATLEVAQANKAKDEAGLASAQADLGRYTALVGSGYQSRQSVDQQKATVLQLQAALKSDQAQIDAAQLNLNFCDIRAPISGRLGVRLVDIGNMVHAADPGGLVTITQTKPIFVTFTLPQNELHKIHEKQVLAPLTTIAYGDDDVTKLGEGKLAVIDNTIDPSSGTIRLKSAFANLDERLWPGEFVNVRLILRIRKGVPVVPAETVQEGEDGKYVYVIKPDNTVERRKVAVASVQDGVAIIAKGLKIGESVVVQGQYRLVDGSHVQIRPPATKAAS
ncbi:MAG TPA: efflux RND transporter periplasmic adaptor subunit [Stellaceae bacterium]|nr:efflux RND transporter periplasmic adaptor subunit [Stellaceae bacterium]